MASTCIRTLTLVVVISLVWQIPCPSIVWSSDFKPLLSQISDDTPAKNSETNQLSIAPIQVYLEPDSGATAGGRTSLFLRVITRLGCSAISIRITDERNLGFTGATEWVLSTRAVDTIQYHLPITLPLNDTSGMSVYAEGCGTRWDAACYFVPTTSGLTIWWDDPRNSLEAALKRSYSKRIGISDSEYWERMKSNNGQTLIGYPDEKDRSTSEDSTKAHGHLISVDSAHKIGLDEPKPIFPKPGDTGTVEITTPPPQPVPTAQDAIDKTDQLQGMTQSIIALVQVHLVPIDEKPAAGPTRLKMWMIAGIDCPDYVISILDNRNLNYKGALEWRFPGKAGDTVTYLLPVNLPADDTSGMHIKASGCGGKWETSCYFTPGLTRLVVWGIDPRLGMDARANVSYSKRVGISDSEYWERMKPNNGQTFIGYPDGKGGFISEDSGHILGLDLPAPIYPGPGDTGVVEFRHDTASQDDPVVKNEETTRLDYLPISVLLTPDSSQLRTGPSRFLLTIVSHINCPMISIRIADARNLSFGGDLSWVVELGKGDTARYILPVTIPSDTSGMTVLASGCGEEWSAQCYLVPSNEKVSVWWGDPRNSLEAALKSSYSKRIGISDSEYWERMKPNNGQTFIGYPDGKGGFISEDSGHILGLDLPAPFHPGPGDTGRVATTSPPAPVELTKEEKVAEQRRQMYSLEQTPLTTADRQEFVVGDSAFIRRRGESAFHPAEWTTNPVEYSKRKSDSIFAAHSNDPVSRLVDLSVPEDLTKAQSLADSLTKVNDSGLYNLWTRVGKLKLLREQGIKVVRPPRKGPRFKTTG